MIQTIDLGTLEKKAYLSFRFEDGILDLYCGLLTIATGVASLLSTLGMQRPWNIFSVIIPVSIFLFWGKKYISRPRIGHVKFGPKRVERTKNMTIVYILSVVVTTALVIMTLKGLIPESERPFLWPVACGLYLMVVFSLTAYFIDFRRLYIYSVVWCVCCPLAEYLHRFVGAPLDGLIVFGIPGVVISLYGFNRMIRFIKRYPLQNDPAHEGGGE